MAVFFPSKDKVSVSNIARDRELVFEVINRVESGESFENVLFDVAIREGVVRNNTFLLKGENFRDVIKSVIRDLVSTVEMRMVLIILSMYEKSDFKVFLSHVKHIARLLERKAFNRELRDSMERKLLVKISMIAGALSFATGIVLGALPRVLSSFGNGYQTLNPIHTHLLLINLATMFSLSTYFVLRIFQEKEVVVKLQPIIIFLIAVVTYIFMIV